MRVWGTILLTLGIIIGVLIFLPVFAGILLTEKETQNVNSYLTFAVIFFAIPALLLIMFGRKLRRKGFAAEEREQAAWTRKVAPAFTPVAASSARNGSAPKKMQAEMSYAVTEKQVKRHFAEAPPKFVVPKVTAPPKTVVCRSCGASQNMVRGQEAACEYCGTILKA